MRAVWTHKLSKAERRALAAAKYPRLCIHGRRDIIAHVRHFTHTCPSSCAVTCACLKSVSCSARGVAHEACVRRRTEAATQTHEASYCTRPSDACALLQVRAGERLAAALRATCVVLEGAHFVSRECGHTVTLLLEDVILGQVRNTQLPHDCAILECYTTFTRLVHNCQVRNSWVTRLRRHGARSIVSPGASCFVLCIYGCQAPPWCLVQG